MRETERQNGGSKEGIFNYFFFYSASTDSLTSASLLGMAAAAPVLVQ